MDGRVTVGQSYYLGTLAMFAVGYAVFLYLRYACANSFVKWHLLLWGPFAATLALSVLAMLYAMIPKGTWDMGPAAAILLIGPFLIALALTICFHPSYEAFCKPVAIIFGIFYAAYMLGFLYFVISPVGRLKI